jgi:hypothetical protein
VTLADAKFERIESKIADIQKEIDKGIMAPGVTGGAAIEALRDARTEVFRLREIIRDSIEIEPVHEPEKPDAA